MKIEITYFFYLCMNNLGFDFISVRTKYANFPNLILQNSPLYCGCFGTYDIGMYRCPWSAAYDSNNDFSSLWSRNNLSNGNLSGALPSEWHTTLLKNPRIVARDTNIQLPTRIIFWIRTVTNRPVFKAVNALYSWFSLNFTGIPNKSVKLPKLAN